MAPMAIACIASIASMAVASIASIASMAVASIASVGAVLDSVHGGSIHAVMFVARAHCAQYAVG